MGSTNAVARCRFRSRAWVTSSLLALVLVLVVPWGSTHAAPQISDLEGLSLRDGTPTRLESQRQPGSWTIVMVWATTCHICVGEFPKYSEYHLKNAKRGREVVGIVLDGAGNEGAVKAFYERTGAKFPSLVADFLPFAASYQAMAGETIAGTPTFLLFAPSGGLVGLHQGPLRIDALEKFIARKSGRTGV